MARTYFLALVSLSLMTASCAATPTKPAEVPDVVLSPESAKLRDAGEAARAKLENDDAEGALRDSQQWLQTPYARMQPNEPEVLELLFTHARASLAQKDETTANRDFARLLHDKHSDIARLAPLMAEARCLQATRLLPREPERGLALATQSLKSLDLSSVDRALAMARCERMIGSALYGLKRESEAVSHFESALRLVDPVNATTRRVAVIALVYLAEAAHTRRDSIAAENHLDRAVGLMELDAAANPERYLDLMLRLFRTRLFLHKKDPDTTLISRILRHIEQYPEIALGRVPGADTLIDIAVLVDAEELDRRILEQVHFRVIRRQFPNEHAQALESSNAETASPADDTHVENASRVLAGLRGEFRNCYNKGLAEDPNERGSIQLKLDVAADGNLSEITAMCLGVSESTANCVVAATGTRRFMAPKGGHAVIRLPVTFVKQ